MPSDAPSSPQSRYTEETVDENVVCIIIGATALARRVEGRGQGVEGRGGPARMRETVVSCRWGEPRAAASEGHARRHGVRRGAHAGLYRKSVPAPSGIRQLASGIRPSGHPPSGHRPHPRYCWTEYDHNIDVTFYYIKISQEILWSVLEIWCLWPS